MNATPPLQADRDQIGRFVKALFRYADEGSFVSLRAFFDDEQRVFAIEGHAQTGELEALIDAAFSLATRAARFGRPIVFAPPIATFRNAKTATEADLVNGLALSVECDRQPEAARSRLEGLLGPATIIVASGGEWSNPETGELEPKLHLHWRLSEPTRDQAGHQALKAARSLAMELVGSDPTSKPTVHPMRWPGSFHRKGLPRLARIVSEIATEIDLQDALEQLRAAGAASTPIDAPGEAPGPGADTKESRDTASLVASILAGAEYHAPIVTLAMRYLKGGMADAQVVLTLRGLMEAVPEVIRDSKDGLIQAGRWQSRFDDIARAVSTARTKLGTAQPGAASVIDVSRFRLDSFTSGEPEPQQFLLEPLIPRGKLGVIFGPGGVGKSLTALDLCLAVAIGGPAKGPSSAYPAPLGGKVPADATGASIFLTLEDDAAEVHRRTASLDPDTRRFGAPCFVITAVDLPDFDPALVTALGRTGALTDFAQNGLDRLIEDTERAAGCKVRLLVLDPAGDFLDADENDATYVKLLMRRLRTAAAKHGCTIVLLGHVAKALDADGPSMRGSTAWVANSRFAYALWRPSPDEAEKLARKLEVRADTLVWGKLVKANHAAAPIGLKHLFTLDARSGRLLALNPKMESGAPSDAELLPRLVEACAECAAAGLPYSYSGVAGLWNGRADLPDALAMLSKGRLERLGTTALETGALVKTRTALTQGAPKYLDIPNGPLARGQEITPVHGSRQEALARWRTRQRP